MEHPTPLRRWADTRIDGGLEAFVAERRTAGRSWRLISRDLHTLTEGEVDVTDVTLRAWFADLTAEAS